MARFVCDTGTFTDADGSFNSRGRSLHLVAPVRTAFNNAAPANRALSRTAIMDGYERDSASPGSSGTTVGDVRRTMLGESGSNDRFIGGSSRDRHHRDIESERAGESPAARRAREEREARERGEAEEARVRAAGLSGDAANRALCDPLRIPAQDRIRGMPNGDHSGDANAILSSCGRGVIRGVVDGIRGVIHSIPDLARLVWRLGTSGIRALGEYGEALADAAHAGSMQPLEDFIERRTREVVDGILGAVRALGTAGEAAADRFACLNDDGKTEFVCSAMGELLSNVVGGEAIFAGASRVGRAAYARAVSAVGRVRGEAALARTASSEGTQLAQRAESAAASSEAAAAREASGATTSGASVPADTPVGTSLSRNGEIRIRSSDGGHVATTPRPDGTQVLRVRNASTGATEELMVIETRAGEVPRVRGADGRVRALTADDIRAARAAREAPAAASTASAPTTAAREAPHVREPVTRTRSTEPTQPPPRSRGTGTGDAGIRRSMGDETLSKVALYCHRMRSRDGSVHA